MLITANYQLNLAELKLKNADRSSAAQLIAAAEQALAALHNRDGHNSAVAHARLHNLHGQMAVAEKDFVAARSSFVSALSMLKTATQTEAAVLQARYASQINLAVLERTHGDKEFGNHQLTLLFDQLTELQAERKNVRRRWLDSLVRRVETLLASARPLT